MELRHIKYLLAVADHGNFTRAAEALHVSQPTLSQQIRQLERELGVALLDRSGRGVHLTDAGEAYARHARLALRNLAAGERAVHDVADLSRGQLRVGLTPTFTPYLIGPLVHRFQVAHPGVTLAVYEFNQDRIEADLLADRLDLGIAFAGPHIAGIDQRTLFTETLSLVVGSAHPLATTAAQIPVAEVAEVAELTLGLLSSDFATRLYIDAYFADHGLAQTVARNIRVEANSIGALLEFLRRGTLATVLPDAIVDEYNDLHRVALEPALPTRTVQLLQRATGHRSVAAHAFTEVVDAVATEQRS